MTQNTAATAAQWIAYYRVSTKRQGLGLDAQRARVQAAAAESGAEIIAEIEEKRSGKECNRPGLNRALALARHTGAIIAVAKHDRLSRDLGYASELVFKSGVKFNLLNMTPEAMSDPLIFAVNFGMAMKEAQLISERTKAALQALKAKGVRLGRPDAATSITPEMREAADAARRAAAAENSNNIAAANEIRRYLSKGGKPTLQAIAEHLTDNGYYTARGVFHTPKSVSLLCRAQGISRK